MQKFANLQGILEKEIFYEYIHSSGPGGQNVNKVATAVQLHFDVNNSPSLTVEVKERLMKLAGRRLTQENRSDADQRLMVLLNQAVTRPKRRRPTQPTLVSRVRRLEDKKRRGRVKHLRKFEKHQDLA
jgi:ribosome-associated protein